MNAANVRSVASVVAVDSRNFLTGFAKITNITLLKILRGLSAPCPCFASATAADDLFKRFEGCRADNTGDFSGLSENTRMAV